MDYPSPTIQIYWCATHGERVYRGDDYSPNANGEWETTYFFNACPSSYTNDAPCRVFTAEVVLGAMTDEQPEREVAPQ